MISLYRLSLLLIILSFGTFNTYSQGRALPPDEKGVTKVSPVKDEANVNKRRAAVGLMPLEEYLKLFNITYTLPK